MQKNSVLRWEDETSRIAEGQVEAVLCELGIQVESETDTHYLIYCPFHNNHHSPAATIAKHNGFLYCWGGSCGKRMKLVDLVREIKNCNIFQAKRFVNKYAGQPKSLNDMVEEMWATKEEMPSFPAEVLESMQKAYDKSPQAREYIESRGILQKTAKHFGIGFDIGRNMIVTPMFDTDSRCIGVIGRSILEKRFKNSKDLPSRKSLFNIQNAKKAGSDSLVLVESNFDAIRIHQSGYPNVCATLGATFSQYHLTQINRHFNRIILMTDGDDAGLKFADKITEKSRATGLSVMRGRYSEATLFPGSAKDASDCTDEDIAWMIRNADLQV